MPGSLLSHVRASLTPLAVLHVSAFLDERPSSTREAIEATVLALLSGLIERTSSPARADMLLTVINRVGQGIDLSELSEDEETFEDLMRSGHAVLGTIFGGLSSTVADHVADTTGLRPLSAFALTAMLAPIVLGIVGRDVSSKGLDASGLAALLAVQRDEVTRVLPAGLSRLFASAAGPVPTPGLPAPPP